MINHVLISYSDDKLETWSHEMRFPLTTANGKTPVRVILSRQGSAVERVYRWRYTGNTSCTLISAHADISVGV